MTTAPRRRRALMPGPVGTRERMHTMRALHWLANGHGTPRSFTLWLFGDRLYIDWHRTAKDFAVTPFWLSLRAARAAWVDDDTWATGWIILGWHIEFWRADRPINTRR
jgi:hypothetical protein